MADPGVELALALGAGVYVVGLRRAWRTAGPRRLVTPAQVRFALAGWCATAMALLPPLDTAAARSLTAHMAQHVLLLAVAAPLLAAGAPSGWWCGRSRRRGGGRRWPDCGGWRTAVIGAGRRGQWGHC